MNFRQYFLFFASKVLSIYHFGIQYMSALNYLNLHGYTKNTEPIYEIDAPLYIYYDDSQCIKVNCRMGTGFEHYQSKCLHWFRYVFIVNVSYLIFIYLNTYMFFFLSKVLCLFSPLWPHLL